MSGLNRVTVCGISIVGSIVVLQIAIHMAMDAHNFIALWGRALYLSGRHEHQKAQVAPILDFIFPAVGCGLTFGSLNNGKCKLWIGITFSLAIAVTLVALEMYYPHFLHFDLWWLSLDSTDALRLELNMGVWSAVAAFVPVFAYYKRNINVGK